MELELDDETRAALEKKATASGMSLSSYANLVMQEQVQEGTVGEARRKHTLDAFLEHMRTSTANLGRDGRDWREFIHEGHER